MKTDRSLSLLNTAGMVLVLAGVIIHLSDISYAYLLVAIGLLPVIGIRIYNLSKSSSADHRKHMIHVMSSLALAAACVSIYFDTTHWVVFILIFVVLDLYISFRGLKG